MRKLLAYTLIFAFTSLAVYAAQYFEYAGTHVSPHGIMLSHWTIDGPASGPSPQLNHPVGKPIEASFTLTNVSDQPILLSEMYVACRFSGKAEDVGAVESHDFGFVKNVFLNPGQSKTLHASFPLSKPGNWRLWPAYRIGDEKSPLRWHDFIILAERRTVTAGASGGSLTFAGPALSPDGLKISDFHLDTSKNPKVGSYASASYVLTNASAKPITLAPDGVYISARAQLPTDVEDFGFKGMQKITLAPGQSITVHGGKKLDKPGLWFFWPGYKILGGNTVPFKWHDLDVVVQ